MPVLPIKAGVPGSRSAHVWADLFLAPVLLLLALVVSLFLPVPAYASADIIPISLARNVSQTASAAANGLTVLEAGVVSIGAGATPINTVTGNGVIGQVLINEVRAMPMSVIAARAVTMTVGGAVAMIAVDLAAKGIVKCLSSPNGWCGPQQSPNAGDAGYNGHLWNTQIASGPPSAGGDSPAAACQAEAAAYNQYWGNPAGYGASVASVVMNSATQYTCNYNILHKGSPSPSGDWTNTTSSAAYSQTGCVSVDVASGSNCVPNPNLPAGPITYPQLSPMLAQVLGVNPNEAANYWNLMDADMKANALADPATQAMPAQIVSPANGQVKGPVSTTTTSAGTSTSQQTSTVAPNTDAGTLAANPVTVTTTTTTTNPDGTTTTTTITQNPITSGGANPSPLPASSPIPCGGGGPGSPPCLIDETGTKTQSDVDSAQQTQTSALTQAESGLETAANQQMSQVDDKHTASTGHFLTILNMIPSFASETCTPPSINDTFNHVNITPAICDWYYAAKDVLSLVIAFGFMLGAVFMVRDAARVGAS